MGRYLPATRVKAGSLQLGDVCVRAKDGRALGKLLGFVIDSHRIRSLVVETNAAQLEVPMGPLQVDPQDHSLRMVDHSGEALTVFSPHTMPVVEDSDLWVPIFHSAA